MGQVALELAYSVFVEGLCVWDWLCDTQISWIPQS